MLLRRIARQVQEKFVGHAVDEDSESRRSMLIVDGDFDDGDDDTMSMKKKTRMNRTMMTKSIDVSYVNDLINQNSCHQFEFCPINFTCRSINFMLVMFP